MNRLKELREEKNYTQKKLASLLFMSQTGYSSYESEKRDIPTKILIRLSEIYEVSVGYILGVED